MKVINPLYALAFLLVLAFLIDLNTSSKEDELKALEQKTNDLQALVVQIQNLKKTYKGAKAKKALITQWLESGFLKKHIKSQKQNRSSWFIEFEGLKADGVKFLIQKLVKHKVWMNKLSIEPTKNKRVNLTLELKF